MLGIALFETFLFFGDGTFDFQPVTEIEIHFPLMVILRDRGLKNVGKSYTHSSRFLTSPNTLLR